MRKVAVAGVGLVRISEHWERTICDLFADAALQAMKDAGTGDIDGLYVGNMSGSLMQEQLNMGALMADALAKPGLHAVRVEAGSASGGVAFHEAVKAVASGYSDCVLVAGAEKMSDVLPEVAAKSLVMEEEQEYSAYTGVTKAGLSAMLHRLYMDLYAEPGEVGMMAVQSHENAVGCRHAQYPFRMSIERAMDSPMEADPIHMMECAGVGDGAAAEKAYRMAEVKPGDIDLVEVHDDYTINGVLSLESLGLVEAGKAAKLVAEGGAARDGKIPTNSFGGLKARGNPLGATGVYQVAEVALQLRGAAGDHQVEGAQVGLAQTMGGLGSTCAVTILRRRGP
jgi:acetyl-CoA C-acetyltransferase